MGRTQLIDACVARFWYSGNGLRYSSLGASWDTLDGLYVSFDNEVARQAERVLMSSFDVFNRTESFYRISISVARFGEGAWKDEVFYDR